MNRPLKSADLRDFAHRRWDLVGRAKLGFLADRFKTGGPLAARAAAIRLFARWQALHPDTVSPERRADDLASHVALKRRFDQASHGLRGR